jgi:hypothetical protein
MSGDECDQVQQVERDYKLKYARLIRNDTQL